MLGALCARSHTKREKTSITRHFKPTTRNKEKKSNKKTKTFKLIAHGQYDYEDDPHLIVFFINYWQNNRPFSFNNLKQLLIYIYILPKQAY